MDDDLDYETYEAKMWRKERKKLGLNNIRIGGTRSFSDSSEPRAVNPRRSYHRRPLLRQYSDLSSEGSHSGSSTSSDSYKSTEASQGEKRSRVFISLQTPPPRQRALSSSKYSKKSGVSLLPKWINEVSSTFGVISPTVMKRKITRVDSHSTKPLQDLHPDRSVKQLDDVRILQKFDLREPLLDSVSKTSSDQQHKRRSSSTASSRQTESIDGVSSTDVHLKRVKESDFHVKKRASMKRLNTGGQKVTVPVDAKKTKRQIPALTPRPASQPKTSSESGRPPSDRRKTPQAKKPSRPVVAARRFKNFGPTNRTSSAIVGSKTNAKDTSKKPISHPPISRSRLKGHYSQSDSEVHQKPLKSPTIRQAYSSDTIAKVPLRPRKKHSEMMKKP